VNHKPSYPFSQYTGLTKGFLQENGTRSNDVVQVVLDDFLGDIPKDQMLVISHGLKNDRKIMLENKLNLSYDEKTLKDIPGYCTFTHAKNILGRNEHMKLDDLAEETGFYLDGAHNAFHDAWATVAVFTWLKKIEGDKE
jgi:DNA polymerase III epsilon subunit-like protein